MRHLDLVLLSGEDEETAAVEGLVDAIQVMTIHQAKGLEFEAVFVPGLVEGRLPQSGRSPRFELPPAVLEPLVRGREDVVAEERRLLYVAMTRARQRLYLTRASHYEGGRRWRDSRFLAEVRSAGARTVMEREVPASSRPAPAPPSRLRGDSPLGARSLAEPDPGAPPSRLRGDSPLGARGLAEPDPGAPPSIRGEGDVVLSYSSISTYRDCPRQYWYRYEQRLPVVQSAEAVHGVILHEVLRRAGEARQGGKKVTAALLGSLHSAVWSSTPFPDARRAPTFKRNGKDQLEAYRKQGGFDSRPEFLEQQFVAKLDGWTLRGVIDRVDRTESGWKILDYKSGRPVARGRRDLQVALYAIGAASLNGDVPTQIALEVIYLASGETHRLERADAAIAEAKNQGAEVAEGAKAGMFEARPERRRCRLCPYRLVCSEAL